MGFRLSFGLGPFRYSTSTRRRKRRKPAQPRLTREQRQKNAARAEADRQRNARHDEWMSRTAVVAVYDVHHRSGVTTFKFKDHLHGDRIVDVNMSDADQPEYSGIRSGKVLYITFSPDGTQIVGISA